MASMYKSMFDGDERKIDTYCKNFHRNSKASQFTNCDDSCRKEKVNEILVTDPLDQLV